MERLTESTPQDGAKIEADEGADQEFGGEAPRVHVPLKDSRPEDVAVGIRTFDDLPLHERIREAITKIGWPAPTPVQKLCLPFTLRGRDVAGFAQTGTGKTAVFLMTIVNKLLTPTAIVENQPETAAPREERRPRAIVLAPTRELAMQIEQDAEVMFAHAGLTTLAVFGGIDYDKQARRLKEGVDVIFATPGRLMDYVKKQWVELGQIEVFVCDEADRMFDMGFIEDVEFFLNRIPETAQKLLFSATTNEQVKELAFEYLETPEYISVNPETLTPEKIEQHAIHCHATDKLKVLVGLLREQAPECALVFTNTKLTAEWLHFKLTHNGFEADLITGDLPQSKRIRLIQRIKEGKLKALIATDVASRGLHISRVTHVYNFDLPDDPANYVHRVGRTARAGAKGYAYSLVCDDYGQNLAGINDLLGPQIALRTEWPEERFLQFEDKAGNPFQDRYRKKPSGDTERPRRFGADGDFGGRGGGRGKSHAPGDSQSAHGVVTGRQEKGHEGDHRRPQGDKGPGGRRGRRDRQDRDHRSGHGAQGGEHAVGGRGGNHGAAKGGHRGHGATARGRGRDEHAGGRSREAHAAMHAPQAAGEAAPKTTGGMLKKLFKTLFGWGASKP